MYDSKIAEIEAHALSTALHILESNRPAFERLYNISRAVNLPLAIHKAINKADNNLYRLDEEIEKLK